MKVFTAILGVSASLLLVSNPALALRGIVTTLSCPAQAAAGAIINVDVHLESLGCSESTVRLISSIAGNTNQSAAGLGGGIGIFGPVVAEAEIAVPASPDCYFTPGLVDMTIAAPPALPSSLVGTVATYIVVAEWDDTFSTQTKVASCMVEVLAP